MMQTLKTLLILSVALTTVCGYADSNPPENKEPIEPVTPQIEVTFVLDTTGSMGGLIHAAKEKIWAIANTLSTCETTPQIKMGLVGYRDRGDAYITKITHLNSDLDAVYMDLIEFQAQGGGDGPESVNQALYEAVTHIKWDTNPETYRVIFLVGDFPPHMDYDDDIRYPETCKLAAKKNIIINTLQCGQHGNTTPIWKKISHLAEGKFFQLAQSGNAVLISTPFDNEMAQLSLELDKTRIYYGSAEVRAAQIEREKVSTELYQKSSASSTAQRAAYNADAAGKDNFLGKQELVNNIKTKEVSLKEIQKEELPEELQKLSLKELETHIEAKSQLRQTIQKKIKDISVQRQEYILNKKKNNTKTPTLDETIYECIKAQAAQKNILYNKGPQL